jgi:hypothetical protein
MRKVARIYSTLKFMALLCIYSVSLYILLLRAITFAWMSGFPENVEHVDTMTNYIWLFSIGSYIVFTLFVHLIVNKVIQIRKMNKAYRSVHD